MKNVTITDISGDDVDFDQKIDSDSVTALAGGVAVNGDVDDSAARRDWGWQPAYDFERAMAEYLSPNIRAFYARQK